MNSLDLIGRRFHRLTVTHRTISTSGGKIRWGCQCDCGGTTIAQTSNLVSGHSKSCGCVRKDVGRARGLNNVIHGEAYSTEYRTWHRMMQRCYNPKSTCYKNWGGRGITVCKRWGASFDTFLSDMGRKPSRNHSIDRINNDGNYEPGNCRWATAKEQANNKRQRMVEAVKG